MVTGDNSLVRLLAGRWTCSIIRTLGTHGPTRFSALRRQIGRVSAKVLTERLRRLQVSGLLSRHVQPTVPPEVVYGLTHRGKEVYELMQRLNQMERDWRVSNRAVGNNRYNL